MTYSRLVKGIFIGIFAFAVLIFSLHYYVVGNAVWGDGRYYFVYLRSAVIDRDLDFSNERLVDPFYFDFKPTPIGKVGNQYSIGPPLFWAPAYIGAHGISVLGSFLGLPLSTDGYGHLYRYLVGIMNVGYALTGLVLAYKSAKLLTKPSAALVAVITTALGTHAFYYLAVDPINSHPPSIFIASLIVYYWLFEVHNRPVTMARSFLLGAMTGLLALVRSHDIIFALPLIIYVLSRPAAWFHKLIQATFFIFGIGFTFLPQLLVWFHLYGTLQSPYLIGGDSYFDVSQLHLLEILFSTNNGLFFFAPLLLLGVYGLWQLRHRHPQLAWAGLTLFLMQTIILASWSGWWGGESFGGRMFLSLTPLFMIGIAQSLSRLPLKTSLAVCCLGIVQTQIGAFWYLLTH